MYTFVVSSTHVRTLSKQILITDVKLVRLVLTIVCFTILRTRAKTTE